MSLDLDERTLIRELERAHATPEFRRGVVQLASDPFFVAFFLVSVSQGEGLGEAAVAMIGQDELAARIRDLDQQEADERGHKIRTLDVARDLYPQFFEDGRYRWEGGLMGRPYYVKVLEANRERLKTLGRYSRLNLYLTTTFGYEVMVIGLYRAVADAVAESPLEPEERRRIRDVLEGILAEEETHVGVVAQHEALLATPRGDLSADAREMLEALGRLETGDYVFAADLAVRQVVEMMSRYADPERYRLDIERGVPST